MDSLTYLCIPVQFSVYIKDVVCYVVKKLHDILKSFLRVNCLFFFSFVFFTSKKHYRKKQHGFWNEFNIQKQYVNIFFVTITLSRVIQIYEIINFYAIEKFAYFTTKKQQKIVFDSDSKFITGKSVESRRVGTICRILIYA